MNFCYNVTMNPWSIRRKRIIFSIVFLSLILLIGVPLYFILYKAPSCFDGKKNADEAGIDCGGSCKLLCTADSLPLILKGDPRIIKISDNLFEVVALLENPNATGEVYRAEYSFKLYDSSSLTPVKVIEGKVYIPKGSTFALFEGPFQLEKGVVPNRAILEWNKDSLVWKKSNLDLPEFKVKDLRVSRENSRPRLDALVENVSLENIYNIDLVAFVYDMSGNIFTASKTFIEELPTKGSLPVVFSWPQPFDKEVFRIEIVAHPIPVQGL